MRFVVTIPTYRRPVLLDRLLRQVVQQAEELRDRYPVRVVVGDNACQDETRGVVEAVAARAGVPVHYLPVPERGISQARNALVREAYRLEPGFTHVVMYDDDGELTPGCLGALLATAKSYDADCVGGPVDMGDLAGASALVRAYLDGALPDHESGLVPTLNGAQNVLVSRRLLDRLGDPWFAVERGLSGGEDYEFFLRAQECSARMAWAADARVEEPLPPGRLTRYGAVRRAFVENAANAHTQVAHAGRRAAVRAWVGASHWVAVQVAQLGLHRDRDHAARLAITTACLAGRGAGLLGLDPQPYR